MSQNRTAKPQDSNGACDSTRRSHSSHWQHGYVDRRCAIEAGAISLLGLGTNHLFGLRQLQAATPEKGAAFGNADGGGKAKACIFIFLSGGLAQHESFDPKPLAPADVRGEFGTIGTQTPGVHYSEHLPLLAAMSQRYALIRTVTHTSNDHSAGHHIMLTGRSILPPGFDPNAPSVKDYPSIAALIGRLKRPNNNLPPSIVLPERLVHTTGRVIPGQGAGMMGRNHDPWFIEASPFHNQSYGAFPQFEFDHQQRGKEAGRKFEAPHLALQPDSDAQSATKRLQLLTQLKSQSQTLSSAVERFGLDESRQKVISMLTDGKIHAALQATSADPKRQEHYGANSFGWSLMMARELVALGVPLVQVNLGNDETWDTHGNAFPNLKDKLLPPTDKALAALFEDMAASGLLEETLVVVASEFGRTPKISHLTQHYKLPGRDHWGALQSVLLAGAGIAGGMCLGKSDALGAYPSDRPVTPEELAATIYHALGIPATATWQDAETRPHAIYYGEPIRELFT